MAYIVHFVTATNVAYLTDLVGAATTLNTVNGVLSIAAPAGYFIDYIDFAPAVGTTVRVDGVSTFVTDDTKTKDIAFGFNAIDGDGDTVIGSVIITAQNSHTLTGTANDDALGGGTGSDTLSGSALNDILTGGQGDDILVGGQGNDILTGGLGADTFKWNSGDGAGTGINDKITDFNIAQHDVLDLASLLTGEHANAGSLDSFLTFAKSGSDTVITVHADGLAATNTQTITLQGLDLVTGHTNQQIIQSLLDGGNLKTDI